MTLTATRQVFSTVANHGAYSVAGLQQTGRQMQDSDSLTNMTGTATA